MPLLFEDAPFLAISGGEEVCKVELEEHGVAGLARDKGVGYGQKFLAARDIVLQGREEPEESCK